MSATDSNNDLFGNIDPKNVFENSNNDLFGSIDPTNVFRNSIEPAVAAASEPVVAPLELEAAPLELEAAPLEPEAAPSEPVAAPLEPVIAPSEPIAAPSEPEVAPSEPVMAPSEPEVIPEAVVPEVIAPKPSRPRIIRSQRNVTVPPSEVVPIAEEVLPSEVVSIPEKVPSREEIPLPPIKEALPAAVPPSRAPIKKTAPATVLPSRAPIKKSARAPIIKPLATSSIDPLKLEKYRGYTNPEMIELWETETNFTERDYIVAELQQRTLFPSAAADAWASETGAYPDVQDPEFLQKLLAKREFADSLQHTWKPQTDPCNDDTTFEVTPVQRFVTNFMSPKTPYMSALLYHGVGVGKTCAAIQITEAWLEFFPNDSVIIVSPPTIKKGFLRTIFDISKVTIGTGNEPNSASQCTGTTYMKLTNTLYERNVDRIKRSVDRFIAKRYTFFGYNAFANYINRLLTAPKGVTAEGKELYKKEQIRKHFSGRFLIVDEAHNLRDINGEDDIDALEMKLDGKQVDDDNGKLLTPFLRYVLQFSEGMKFCALTATPMYNTYREIIFMFNLLLLNDKKALLTEKDIFTPSGEMTPMGAQRIADIATHYVSFMRGENPISFPIRLFPTVEPLATYPTTNPRGVTIPEEDRTYYQHLPIVPIPLQGDILEATLSLTNELKQSTSGLSTTALEKLVHAGTFIVPETASTRGNITRRIDTNALETVFTRERRAKETFYTAKAEVGAAWLSVEQIGRYSPKFEFLLQTLQNAEGCCFVYSRFVHGGAIPLALALEANGYTPYLRTQGLLVNGIQSPGGRQCALCPRREKDHSGMDHTFVAATYGLLTGDTDISPNNEAVITAQRAFTNANGEKMKIIIGSQIASEGVDLRFIRETHLIDAWYHLNKTEQILGRAIRFLSHCALPVEKRNNTVYLYAAVIPGDDRETADLYSYRVGFKKAVSIGNVTRIMKQSAVDCNLNRDAIVISGQDTVTQRDSQRRLREDVTINDMPFTAVCDWIETCEYQCNPSIDVSRLKMDDSTYDEFSARWRIHQVKERIKLLFVEQPFYQSENIWELFADIPRMALVDVFNDIINNKTFQVRHNNISGYIRYCNGYYLFQPNAYTDLSIPLAIRSAQFPIKRDMYIPIEFEEPSIEDEAGVEINDSIGDIWTAITQWVETLAEQAVVPKEPIELNQWRIALAHDDAELKELYSQIVQMIYWFHTSFHRSTNKNTASFRKALLFYFWDQWLTPAEQKWMIYSSGMNIQEYIAEDQYHFKKMVVHRFINPKTSAIEYLCEDSAVCTQALIDAIRMDKEEPLQTFQVTTKTTGSLYGLLSVKSGKIVFKLDIPGERPMEIFRGKECAVVSTMTSHIANLMKVGEILARNGKSSFELTRDTIVSGRKIKNSSRACTLLQFILRYMDAERIENKRWFFRTVQARYIGYKGSSAK